MRKLTGNNPYMPYSAQISQKQDEHNIYVIMKHVCYYAYLAFVRFEHSVCRGSLMTTYIIPLA